MALLVPTFGAIALAIAAAVQAANALVAVLVELPGLLVAVGLQAGIVLLAFHGMSAAIKGAFAAKNATELYEAIKNLTPAARDFVTSLLPLRDVFKQIQAVAQQNFFLGLSNVLSQIAAVLGPIFTGGNFANLARALGDLFRQVGLVFASPAFADLVRDVIPTTLRWLSRFGPGFTSFLLALIKMADAALPALERLGMIVGNAFGTFTTWLNEQVKSGALTGWLNDMGNTLDGLSELFFNVTKFVAAFLGALNQSGGNDTITQLSELFAQLAVFFSSEAGQAAMAGFIHLVELLTFSFSGLVFTMLGLLIAFESILTFLQFVGQEFMDFLNWLGGPAAEAIGTFFTETFPGWVSGLAQDVADFFGKIVYYIESGVGAAIDWVHEKWGAFLMWWGGVVNGFVDFFTGIPGRLADIGRSIMQGLRDGLQWGWDHTVGPILTWITSQIPSWKGPEEKDRKLLEPAGQAVMEGFGRGVQRGAEQLRGMLGDFTGSMGGLGVSGGGGGVGGIVVNVGFHGAMPTEQQAYDTGRAAGRGVGDELDAQISQRNIRLAVRMA